MTHDSVLAHKVARAELMKRVLIVIIAVIVTAILIAVLALLNRVSDVIDEVRATQKAGSPSLRAIAAQQDEIEKAANASSSLNELVLECFDPKSQCARDAAARDAEQAGAYNAAVIAAQFCRDQQLEADYTLHELTVCVGQILEGKGARP